MTPRSMFFWISSAGSMSCKRVVQRAQIRHDFFVKIAGQKTQRFAGFDRRTGQNDATDLFLVQRRDRHRHGQIGFARAGRADAERDVVLADGIEVFFLADGLGGDALFCGRRSGCGRT